MKARCIKLYVYFPEGQVVYNNDMRDFLQIDKIYLIFGLSIKQSILYYYIFDGEHLIVVPKDLFVVIDDRVSKHWCLKEWEDGEITLCPALFYQEDFLENFSEREEKERKLFQDLSIIMEEESNWIKKYRLYALGSRSIQ